VFEIGTKEQIREFLGMDERKIETLGLGGIDGQAIIVQFERWWDKYRVSLHELDAEVKKSEDVMWGYLKELGYE
jgi:type I restriction enzyme M protein